MRRVLYLCFIVINFWGYCDESAILQQAQEKNLPIAAFFLGKECVWSQKLQQDVFNTALFQEKLEEDVILWKVVLSKSDSQLCNKYHIQQCPVVLLLDPHGKEFARFDYAPLTASAFADQILGMIEDFQEVCAILDNETIELDETALQNLYHKAKNFSSPYFKQVILEHGLKMEKGTFFHVEKYASLLEKRKIKNPQVRKVRAQVLKRDPQNLSGTHFKIAALEFQKIASRLKTNDRLEKPIKPLLYYLQQFGKKDSENAWKAELMISEYLFSKSWPEQALEYAETAYKSAPEPFKQKIADAIALMNRSSAKK